MTIEQQVTSLELSKRLKEIGVRQQSCFYWMKLKQNENWTIEFHTKNSSFDHLSHEDWVEICDSGFSAFTVTELGEMLPAEVKAKGTTYTLESWRQYSGNMRRWFTSYEHADGRKNSLTFQMEKTEADARAKMLIYLIENKLI